MRAVTKAAAIKYVFCFLLALSFISSPVEAFAAQSNHIQMITEWQMKWGKNETVTAGIHHIEEQGGWMNYNGSMPLPKRPDQISLAWIKIKIPELEGNLPGALMNKIYGQNIYIFLEESLIFSSERSYIYDNNKILLPLHTADAGKTLYIAIQSAKDRIGLQHGIEFGDYTELSHIYIKRDMVDIILGSAFIFIAVIMFICSAFLRTAYNTSWLSLSLVILSFGILVITYSPFLYTFYGEYGRIFIRLLDIALFTLLPSLTFFIVKIFGGGYRSIIIKFSKFQVAYSIFCFSFMLIDQFLSNKYFGLYYLLSVRILGIIMIVQAVLLITNSLINAVKGNKDALILSMGFALFGLTGISELVWFYLKSGNYDLFLWKWGVVAFVISLILILGRNYSRNHEQVVKYSKELEMFNNELQRSEKLAIISELAASVAHEVRNPLQVTRGFLQLLLKKYDNKDKVYITMALEELDRAASIITDFLTFAKPEFDRISVLNVMEELEHVESIIMPLANLEGGQIRIDVPDHLKVKGNSSKFKQAFINMVKNSIEALNGSGQICIWAYEEEKQVVIHIQDNGEGMNALELARLGEPYFSNKTKGTGLGLMVTFRIIEVMGGNLTFTSEKGVGTEAVIRLPSASEC